MAGSPLVRALFELYKSVSSAGGTLVVVDYPDAYISSLAALGLPDLRRFELHTSERRAVDELVALAQKG